MGTRLNRPLAMVLQSLGRGWRAIRRLSGDDGYERYLAHHATAHPGAPLSRREWFAHQEKQKWGGIKRCC